ncbi:hypothetical protein LCGC14_2897520, partial [marine sediment metagenome]
MGLKRHQPRLNPKITSAMRAASAWGKEVLLVSGQTNGTSMPAKSTENTMESSMSKTSEQLTLLPYQ